MSDNLIEQTVTVPLLLTLLEWNFFNLILKK